MGKPKLDTGKYKYNSSGVCENPDTILVHDGKSFRYKLLVSQCYAGWLIGYDVKEKIGSHHGHSCLPAITWGIHPDKKTASLTVAQTAYDFFAEDKHNMKHQEFIPLTEFIDSLIQSPNNYTNTMAKTTAPKPGTVPEAKFENVPLNKIVADPNQPRTFFDQAALDELTNSVREKGVIQPILLRPSGSKFMIVCGERRYKASLSVNAAFKDRNSIPAVIRNITDDEALELQIIENLQRKDVHPMEEAVAFKSLVEHGKDLKEIAAKIGKSEFYARQRMKLNALTENWQKAFFNGRLSNTTALTVAMFDVKIQEELFAEEDETGEIELTRYQLNKYRGDLSTATFDLADPTLDKKMGACTGCRFNTATAALFELEGGARCTNIGCFKGKTDNHFVKALESSQQDAEIIFIHNEHGGSNDKFVNKLKKDGIAVHGRSEFSNLYVPELRDFEEWKEDEEDDYDDQSEGNLKKQYQETEVAHYEKEMQEYQAKIDSGKYKKAFVVAGDEKGKFIYITLNKKASTTTAKTKLAAGTDEITAEDITGEIARINGREKRNQELDMEKVHVAMLQQLEKSTHLKQPGLAMQDIDRGIMIFLLIKAGSYNFDKVLAKLPGFPAVPDNYRNKYKFTPEFFTKLSQIPEEQLAFIIRKLAFEKYGNKNMGMGIHPEDTVPRLMASYMSVDITAIEKDQKVIADARHERVAKKIADLTKKRSELKKPAAKKSAAPKKK